MNLVTSSLFQNTRIRANFGARPFMYAEGTQHRKAADECHDVTQDIKDTFGALPFHFDSDSDDAASSSVTNSDAGSHGELRASPGLPCRTAMIPKSLRGAAAGYHNVCHSSLSFFPQQDNPTFSVFVHITMCGSYKWADFETSIQNQPIYMSD